MFEWQPDRISACEKWRLRTDGCLRMAAVTAGTRLMSAVPAVMLTVMVAANVLLIMQAAVQEIGDRLIGAAAAAPVQPDSRFRQRHLRAAADAAADQRVCLQLFQNACERAVTLAVRADHTGAGDPSAVEFVDLEILCSSEMLEDIACFLFIGDGYIHCLFSFLS